MVFDNFGTILKPSKRASKWHQNDKNPSNIGTNEGNQTFPNSLYGWPYYTGYRTREEKSLQKLPLMLVDEIALWMMKK